MQKVLEDGTLGISQDDKFQIPQGMDANIDCTGSDSDIVAYEQDSYFD